MRNISTRFKSPLFCRQTKNAHHRCAFFVWWSRGERKTFALQTFSRLGLKSSPLLPKNSSPNCFLYGKSPHWLRFPSTIYKRNETPAVSLFFWWSRGESNPRPKHHSQNLLRVQSVIVFPKQQVHRQTNHSVASLSHDAAQSFATFTFTAV